MKILFIKLQQVIGVLYLPNTNVEYGVIFAKGGPSLGDSGKYPFDKTCKRFKCAIFVTDYIGCCRSDGEFNFKNCIQTLFESRNFLQGKVYGTNIYTNEKISINTNNIILIGSSWGGAIVPFVDKYENSNIDNIGLIKAVTDWKTQGKTKNIEENVELTNEIILKYWGNIYRGYENSEWPDIFTKGLAEFNPIENTHLLKNKRVVLVHGKKDKSINWKKTKKYSKLLNKINPSVKSYFLPEGKHDDKTTLEGINIILNALTSA